MVNWWLFFIKLKHIISNYWEVDMLVRESSDWAF